MLHADLLSFKVVVIAPAGIPYVNIQDISLIAVNESSFRNGNVHNALCTSLVDCFFLFCSAVGEDKAVLAYLKQLMRLIF